MRITSRKSERSKKGTDKRNQDGKRANMGSRRKMSLMMNSVEKGFNRLQVSETAQDKRVSAASKNVGL